jgi:hypothetical protein
MYSFQAKMNENTLVATRPGATRGKVNAVEIIHTIGARVTTATSNPAPLSATARSLRREPWRGAARAAAMADGSEPG